MHRYVRPCSFDGEDSDGGGRRGELFGRRGFGFRPAGADLGGTTAPAVDLEMGRLGHRGPAAGGIGIAFSSHAIRWRARLALARLGGQYHEIPPSYFFRCLRPSSAVDLSPLLETQNVRAAIRNPFTDEHAANEGMRVFNDNCAKCHGEKGTGGAGPSLLAALPKTGDWGYFSTVKWGRPSTLMLPQPLQDREIWATETYVRRLLRASEVSHAKQTAQLSVDVPAAAIVGSSENSDGWLTYAGVLAGHRHSRLRQIDKTNVHRLGLAWTAQFRTTEDALQGSALVAGNVLFVPGPPGEIDALDARTGDHLWQFQRPHAADLALCCGTGNRGVAIVGDHVFAATLDAHLVALDATSGHLLWEVEVADHSEGYSMTSAPLVVGDRVIVGVAGGDYGPRGFLAAFSAKDGHRLWQFDTVPGPGRAWPETWAGDSWRTGGSSTWVTGAADADLGLVYWGVGNPAPVYNAALRQGDNLYSMCAIAIDIQTGKLRWYYQFTPHDEHDWDSANQPMVADIDWPGGAGAGPAVGEPERLFLCARPSHRQVPLRQAVREADLGQGLSARRSAHPRSRRPPYTGRNRGMALGRRGDELAAALVRRRPRAGFHPRHRYGQPVLRIVGGEPRAGTDLPRGRGAHPGGPAGEPRRQGGGGGHRRDALAGRAGVGPRRAAHESEACCPRTPASSSWARTRASWFSTPTPARSCGGATWAAEFGLEPSPTRWTGRR